ncbi:unnamed protein product [Protopolystoma xenopodis]|uniref:Uncharacterized protein n=1 Tax=Protopolystoma xenopodis TaxID=117903 RepID=A0A448XJF3_9PLAT|nr:unnamed protein product [Protopolystoma xenopodis]
MLSILIMKRVPTEPAACLGWCHPPTAASKCQRLPSKRLTDHNRWPLTRQKVPADVSSRGTHPSGWASFPLANGRHNSPTSPVACWTRGQAGSRRRSKRPCSPSLSAPHASLTLGTAPLVVQVDQSSTCHPTVCTHLQAYTPIVHVEVGTHTMGGRKMQGL